MNMQKNELKLALVKGKIDNYFRHSQVSLRLKSKQYNERYLELPVITNGRIHELIKLPADIVEFSLYSADGAEIEQSSIHIRYVGFIECSWRMANRVIGTYRKLLKEQRKALGLSVWRAIFCLPEAYRIVSQLRYRITYSKWISLVEKIDKNVLMKMQIDIGNFKYMPHFYLLISNEYTGDKYLQKTLDSVNTQIYQNLTCVAFDMSGSTLYFKCLNRNAENNAFHFQRKDHFLWLNWFNGKLEEDKSSQWVMLLRAGDVLSPHALYQFACESFAKPGASILYSDDDALDEYGQRYQHRFKPDWSMFHFLSTNYIGSSVVIRGAEIAKAGGLSRDCCRYGSYELILRVLDVFGTDGMGSVFHIPKILMHRTKFSYRNDNTHKNIPTDFSDCKQTQNYIDSDRSESNWCIKAVKEHLTRNGMSAMVSEINTECWYIHYTQKNMPLVSIIIPTRDALFILRQCIDSIIKKTTYAYYEILVVDNQSTDPAAICYLDMISKHEKVRVLSFDRPFNYSAINNYAVKEAKGKVICLLNNDTEVISHDWLEEMVSHLMLQNVGIVGAKLFFSNGLVQHGGDLVGVGGVANHAHSFLNGDEPGYCNRAIVTQELSAVTAACMVTWKNLYQNLNGLNERHLKIAFNDVDYCLRVREAGYRVVWTPHAKLYHYESVSRGEDLSQEKKRRAKREVKYMRKRWTQTLRNDPFYNPNLSYERPDFSLSYTPMNIRPWKT